MNREDILRRMARDVGAAQPETLYGRTDYVVMTISELERFAALAALKAALEQESGWKLSCGCHSQYGGIPAEWPDIDREGNVATAYGVICEKHWHAYEAQHPRREWRGLTDEEIEDCWDGYLSDYQLQMIRAIEAKLKEKNA